MDRPSDIWDGIVNRGERRIVAPLLTIPLEGGFVDINKILEVGGAAVSLLSLALKWVTIVEEKIQGEKMGALKKEIVSGVIHDVAQTMIEHSSGPQKETWQKVGKLDDLAGEVTELGVTIAKKTGLIPSSGSILNAQPHD